jgi:hypothetical protein
MPRKALPASSDARSFREGDLLHALLGGQDDFPKFLAGGYVIQIQRIALNHGGRLPLDAEHPLVGLHMRCQGLTVGRKGQSQSPYLPAMVDETMLTE